MIVKKKWLQLDNRDGSRVAEWKREGWYLFGFIPIYLRDLEARERRF